MKFSKPSSSPPASVTSIKLGNGVALDLELVSWARAHNVRMTLGLPPREGRPSRRTYANLDLQQLRKLIAELKRIEKVLAVLNQPT